VLVMTTVCWCVADQMVKTYGELDGELHLVKLRVDPAVSLGLDLAGNSQHDTMSVFVAGIHPDSPVARSGQIHVGDELLEVSIVVASIQFLIFIFHFFSSIENIFVFF